MRRYWPELTGVNPLDLISHVMLLRSQHEYVDFVVLVKFDLLIIDVLSLTVIRLVAIPL